MSFFIILSLILFFCGLLNLILMSKKNILSFLIASEILFLGIDVFLIGVSVVTNLASGIIFAVIILMIAVGDAAVGLGLCILSLKLRRNINFRSYFKMRF